MADNLLPPDVYAKLQAMSAKPPTVPATAALPAPAAPPIQPWVEPPASVFAKPRRDPNAPDFGLNVSAPAVIQAPPGTEPYVEPPPETFAKPKPPTIGSSPSGDTAPAMPMPMPAKPVYVPGGWQNASRSGRLNISGDTKGTLAAANENAEQAIDQHTTNQVELAKQQAASLDAQNRELENVYANQQGREIERQNASRAAVGKLQDLSSEVNDASNISPEKFWGDKGTLGKVIASIGVAVGGFVAGRTGGPNHALDMVERAIDRDIDAQKARLAAARGKLSEQRGLVGTMREQFGDERMADAAAKHAYLENASRQLDSLVANAASKEVQARAQELKAGLQERMYGQQVQLAQLEQGNLTERYRPGGFVGGGASPTGASQDPKLFVPTGPNGEGYFARTVEAADKIRARRAYALALDEAAKTALAAREKTSGFERLGGKLPTSVFETKDFAALKSAQENVVQAAKRMEEMGQLQGHEKEDVMGLVGNLTDVGGHPEEALARYTAQKRKELEADERAQGGQGGRQTISVDAQGRPVAVANGQYSFAAPRSEMPSGFKAVDGRAAPQGYQTPQKSQPWDGQVAPTKGGKKGGKGEKLTPDEVARLEEISRQR